MPSTNNRQRKDYRKQSQSYHIDISLTLTCTLALTPEQRKIRLRKAAGYMEMLDCLRESSEPNTFQPGVENGEAAFPMAHPKWNKKEKNHSLSSVREDKGHWQESLGWPGPWHAPLPDPATPPCQGCRTSLPSHSPICVSIRFHFFIRPYVA